MRTDDEVRSDLQWLGQAIEKKPRAFFAWFVLMRARQRSKLRNAHMFRTIDGKATSK